MRVIVNRSKNSESLYIIKSIILNGKSTSKVVEKLGTIEAVHQLAGNNDPYKWAKMRAKELTEAEKEGNSKVRLSFSENKQIDVGKKRCFNGGYLFLKQIYEQIGRSTLTIIVVS
jgi:rubrerythrin